MLNIITEKDFSKITQNQYNGDIFYEMKEEQLNIEIHYSHLTTNFESVPFITRTWKAFVWARRPNTHLQKLLTWRKMSNQIKWSKFYIKNAFWFIPAVCSWYGLLWCVCSGSWFLQYVFHHVTYMIIRQTSQQLAFACSLRICLCIIACLRISDVPFAHSSVFQKAGGNQGNILKVFNLLLISFLAALTYQLHKLLISGVFVMLLHVYSSLSYNPDSRQRFLPKFTSVPNYEK